MPKRSKSTRIASTLVAGCLIAATASAATSDRWNLPIVTKKLDNGLTVIVSEDHSSPTVGISVVYRVGIRTEPRNRTGFAHLFEHLMFEGTPKAPHGVFDRVTNDGGGDNNGSTHPDFTSYIDRAPVAALEPLLWLEADRMKTLAFDQESLDGQRDVVKEEIRVNVQNQPYGGFAETDLPLLAFQKWENGHDGYGSFDDLDRASLADVRGFHRDFYGPNNAVLGIAGDVTPEQGFALAQKYFGAISSRATPPRPDVDEPLNTAEKRLVQGDGLAKLPALAVGWKMPARGSRDQAAMIVLGELLAGGDASRLYQSLVKGSALAVQIGSFTGSDSPWEYNGPTLYTLSIIYKTQATADLLLVAIDAQIARIQKEGVDPAALQGLKTRMLSDWYDALEPFVDRAEKLAILHAVWGDARVANQVPDLIDGVTSADIQRVAATYLTHANRSVIDRRPDFLLADGDPARSELREKNKPKPKPTPREGKVTVGEAESLKTAPPPVPASGSAPTRTSPPPIPAQTPAKPAIGTPPAPGGDDKGAAAAVTAPNVPQATPPSTESKPPARTSPAGTPVTPAVPARVPAVNAAPPKPESAAPVSHLVDEVPLRKDKATALPASKSGSSQPEAPKPATSDGSPPNPDVAKPNASKPKSPPLAATAQPSPKRDSSQEVPKQEVPKQGTAKQEAAMQEAAKQEAAKQKAPLPAGSKLDAGGTNGSPKAASEAGDASTRKQPDALRDAPAKPSAKPAPAASTSNAPNADSAKQDSPSAPSPASDASGKVP